MIEKKTINPDKQNLTKKSTIIKRLSIELTRANFRKSTNKELTKEQKDIYQENSQRLYENRQKRYSQKNRKIESFKNQK